MNKLLPVLTLVLLVSACASVTSVSVETPNRTVSFATDVAPVIASSCAACHSAGGASGGVTLCDTSGKAVYADVKAKASSVASTVSSGSMPRGQSLSATNRGLIQAWVDQGALDN